MAVKALSERVPMASADAPGKIARYMFSAEPHGALEYVDQSTGRALLPDMCFESAFLPHPAPDARYIDGFATVGKLMGHLLSRARYPQLPPAVNFGSVKVLNIRTDFIIGTSRSFKDDGKPRESPTANYNFVPWSQQDVEQLIAAGFNYLNPPAALRQWILSQPVFTSGLLSYPVDCYRSNVLMNQMFIDEPMVRLGWSGGVQEAPAGPEVMAQALRMRVASEYTLNDRAVELDGGWLGTLNLFLPKAPSWDTAFWSAWYQLQAGAPGIVHEGRYGHRGHGWDPETLVGEGLEHLTDRDQFNFFFAFLRGAARSFNGSWGTSIYGQSEYELRVPAMIRAYEMGAKYLWFWTSDHEHHVPFTEQLRIARAICDYAKKHPRQDRAKMLRQAKVGIALPPGYAFNWNGTWEMDREQLNSYGISYGDISAAMFWEGLICSRQGIEFDFLVDHPGIEKLGYERLVIIHEDGSRTVNPPWPQKRAPKGLSIAATPEDDVRPSPRDLAHDFSITRAKNIKVDGSLDDWASAKWVELGNDHWFGDTFDVTLNLTTTGNPADISWKTLQGATFEKLTEELIRKYSLDEYAHEDKLVITAVEPGSPAAESGLEEGDVLITIEDMRIKFPMHIDQIGEKYSKQEGKKLEVKVRRSGRRNYSGPDDLSARTAFMIDDSFFYFAAEIKDDAHLQQRPGGDMWMQDCVQIGLDPILDRTPENYGENEHEIGFALANGEPVLWRWEGRRGQPVGRINNAQVKIVRDGGKTLYEAAIPLAQLAPLAPDTWPECGINVVVNDSDSPGHRKGRLELVQGAMTHGKHPDKFAVFECELSGNPRKLSGGLVWDRRCMLEGGHAQLGLTISSPQTKKAIVNARMISLDNPDTKPEEARISIPVTSDPQHYKLRIFSKSPAGRYLLKVSVKSESGWLACEDALPVYVYPAN